jgi:hypothetical protein
MARALHLVSKDTAYGVAHSRVTGVGSMQQKYVIGVIGHSLSKGERRVPIWWEHLTCHHLHHPLIQNFIFEKNFGQNIFQKNVDHCLTQLGCKVTDRLDVLRLSDIVISLKPQNEWLYMKSNSTLVGWFNHLEFKPNCSSGIRLLNFEDIQINVQGKSQKILYENAHVAGECGVAQTLELLSQIDPESPAISNRRRLAVVLGYGNLGKGAVKELLRQGIEKIIVFTQRSPLVLENKLKSVNYQQMIYGIENTYVNNYDDSNNSLIDEVLGNSDIIVNAKIPSPEQPKWTFIPWLKFRQLKRNMAYIDPVHQIGHGAGFAQTTPLSSPVKRINQFSHSIWYNGCNAMPSYRPVHASFVISQAITSYFDDFLTAIKVLKAY